MGVAAVPKYLDKYLNSSERFRDIAPGHRFGFLFPIWNKDGWVQDEKNKSGAIKEVLPVSSNIRALLEALNERQMYLATLAADDLLTVEATSTAPFITGIGNEHPIENGFSFLSPYGLPYLPASAVKGTLRRAAENLALGAYGDRGGWEPLYVWLLFGFDGSSTYLTGPSEKVPDAVVEEEASYQQQLYLEQVQSKQFDEQTLLAYLENILDGDLLRTYKHQPQLFLFDLALPKGLKGNIGPLLREQIHSQGALIFWDVYPKVPNKTTNGELFKIEILTPHHGEYYQHAIPPADCEQPIPNPFLAVASGCRFVFHARCETSRVPSPLKDKWRLLLQRAFGHAFDWLGFGAKTAVGYGQMQPVMTPGQAKPVSTGGVDKTLLPESQITIGRTTEVWEKATLNWKKSDRTLTATHGDGRRRTAPLTNPDKSVVPERYHKKLFEDGKAVIAKVTVSVRGNLWEIQAIEAYE